MQTSFLLYSILAAFHVFWSTFNSLWATGGILSFFFGFTYKAMFPCISWNSCNICRSLLPPQLSWFCCCHDQYGRVRSKTAIHPLQKYYKKILSSCYSNGSIVKNPVAYLLSYTFVCLFCIKGNYKYDCTESEIFTFQ